VQHVYVLYAALAIWSRVHGLVSLEIGGRFPPVLEDIQAVYQFEMDRIIQDHIIAEVLD